MNRCYMIATGTKKLERENRPVHGDNCDESALDVESYFIDKGMKRHGGGLGSADYVYIFL